MNNPSKGILLPKKRNKVVNKPFEEQTVVKKNIQESEAVTALIDLIKEHGDWVEKN